MRFASLMLVSVEASRLTFPEGAVLFSLERPKGSAAASLHGSPRPRRAMVPKGRPNWFGRRRILLSPGIGRLTSSGLKCSSLSWRAVHRLRTWARRSGRPASCPQRLFRVARSGEAGVFAEPIGGRATFAAARWVPVQLSVLGRRKRGQVPQLRVGLIPLNVDGLRSRG